MKKPFLLFVLWAVFFSSLIFSIAIVDAQSQTYCGETLASVSGQGNGTGLTQQIAEERAEAACVTDVNNNVAPQGLAKCDSQCSIGFPGCYALNYDRPSSPFCDTTNTDYSPPIWTAYAFGNEILVCYCWKDVP